MAGFGSVRSFYQHLLAGWETPAAGYDAARNYHHDRDAPAAYLARVLEVFPTIRAQWLLTGEGPMTNDERLQSEAANALERFTAEDFGAGVADGFGAGHPAERLLRDPVRRAALIQVWRRLSILVGDDVQLGRMVGMTLRSPLEELGLELADLPDDAFTDFVLGICGGLAHLSEYVGKTPRRREAT